LEPVAASWKDLRSMGKYIKFKSSENLVCRCTKVFSSTLQA